VTEVLPATALLTHVLCQPQPAPARPDGLDLDPAIDPAPPPPPLAQSLAAVKDVIATLATRQSADGSDGYPFESLALTHLLQDALVGWRRTTFMVTLRCATPLAPP